ncbi:DsbA family protein [Janibacter corallicola]|uniref:DsbA family protein n=1 Tax=Janibacter corallicola TaxID=415212 RepID=UPI0012EEB307|nr:DsbA family protein [Janibacter corallicola]
MTGSTQRILTIVAAVAVVVLLAAGVMFSQDGGDEGSADAGSSAQSSGGGGKSADEGGASEEEIGLVRRDADDVTAMGDVDAPVVLIEYSDYRCPFCGSFARDTMPELKEEYIDTGKLRFEWRDFPVFGEESMEGALAARAAGEQGKYWEYHDAVYEDAPERGHLKITKKKIMDWAKEVGVEDMKKFEKDLDDPRLRKKVEADAQEAATQVKATGTPTFVLGDQRMVGAQPTKAFKDLIDEELEQVEGQ